MDTVEKWAEAAQSGVNCAQADAAALSRLLEEILDKETSYSEQNAKRLNLVNNAFQRTDFETMVAVVDILTDPLDTAVNRLLERTGILKTIRFGVVGHSETADLRNKSKNMFLSWARGDFGVKILEGFLKQLKSIDLARLCETHSCDISMMLFQLAVFAMSDIWRRCIFAVQGFPWCMFTLVSCGPAEFATKWANFRRIMEHCLECVDPAFSIPLLRMPALKEEQIFIIQQLLANVATYSPLATDTVENLHGYHQSALHVFRGSPKTPEAAAEFSILASLKLEHAQLKAVVEGVTMPSRTRVAQQMRATGRTKGGKLNGHKNPKVRAAKQAFAKPRRLSAWNVFLRKKLQEVGSRVPAAEFKDVQRKISAEWAALPQSEKRNYQLLANHQQLCRDDLQERPLLPGRHPNRGGEGQTEEEAEISRLEEIAGRRFREKIGAKRLLKSGERLLAHTAWGNYGLGLQDGDGALKRELIDLQTDQLTINSDMASAVHKACEGLPDFAKCVDDVEAGNTTATCHCQLGFCKKDVPDHELIKRCARQLAKITHDSSLSAGSLVQIAHGESVCMYFLGVFCKKPLLQVLVQAAPVDGKDHAYSLTPSGESLPRFFTSFQVFRELIVQMGPATTYFAVKVFTHSFHRNLWSAQRLEVVASEVSNEFKIHLGKGNSSDQRKAKRDVQLPFGLKPKPKERKPRARNRKGGKGKGKGKGQRRAAKPGKRSRSSLSSDSESSASFSSSCPNASSVGSESEFENDGDKENEVVELPTAAAQTEENEVVELAKELRIDFEHRAEAAKKYTTGGTTFVKELGFAQDFASAIAPTGRSVCYHCQQKILAGSVRFVYFWNIRRPSRYVHSECVVPFVRVDMARKGQAVETMMAISLKLGHSNSASSSSAQADPSGKVKDHVTRLVSELQRL